MSLSQPEIKSPGVYEISIEDYHNGDGISRSKLVEFQKSPYHYWYKANHPEKIRNVEVIAKTNALEFGNALHTYVLEPDEFGKRYAVFQKINRQKKVGKEAYAQFLLDSAGKAIISQDAYDEIRLMSDAIQAHGQAKDLISDAWYEKSIYWTDPDADLLCKVRPDIWHDGFIVDLKTTVSAKYTDFQKSIYNYGYHIQAGMMHEALKHVLCKDVKSFVFVAIEKEPPYALACYQLEDMALDLGVRRFKEIIQGIRKCINENIWPSYESGLINLPSWAFR